jgi:hypothetical protein
VSMNSSSTGWILISLKGNSCLAIANSLRSWEFAGSVWEFLVRSKQIHREEKEFTACCMNLSSLLGNSTWL